MNEQDIIKHIIHTREDIASIKAMLEPLAPRTEAHETRLGVVEGDVKTAKRIIGGLFSLLVAGVVAMGTWLKGVASS